MNQLTLHNLSLRKLYESFEQNSSDESFVTSVNLDIIDTVLREVLTSQEMKEEGSFFTGEQLSTIAVQGFRTAISTDSVVLDPTCGAGNLLIMTSRLLDIDRSLAKTLESWGLVLYGFDIHPSFIEATKLRLTLEAIHRGAEKDCNIGDALSYFPNIKVKDAMSADSMELSTVTHAIMNPPFTSWNTPNKEYWTKGKVNAASVVLYHYLDKLPENCELSAILPDVLRSGTRYALWRQLISEQLTAKCDVFGMFNSKTKVDVFTLQGIKKQNNSSICWFEERPSDTQLSDKFDVCIGPLVAYRDPFEGPSYPFIHTKNAPAWGIISEFNEYRPFKGKVISPPFIAIRRTSSPSDKDRVVCTIITGSKPVAVENHLIVVRPKNSSLSSCKKLTKHLRSEYINEFINRRIRCRHLTATVIKEIPIDCI